MRHQKIPAFLLLFLFASSAASLAQAAPLGLQMTKTLPTDWSAPPPDRADDKFIAANKRYPSLSKSQTAGYEFQLCVPNTMGFVPPSITRPGTCDGYTGYGAIPNTEFAVDASYRFTMRQISPFLEDLHEQVDQEISFLKANIKALSEANDALTKRLNDLEARLNKQDQPK